MTHITELLELVRNYYAQANATTNPAAKQAMWELGNKYLTEVDDLRRSQVVQATFPKT